MTNPQILMLALLSFAAAATLLKNGERYTKNAAHTILISAPLMTTVLWAGGYWEALNAPQIVTIILMTFNCTTSLALHGREEKHNFLAAVADTAIIVALYWWGGFWG